MQTVFSGPVHVSYRQLYVESRVDDDYFEGLNDACGGQTNGLCGAAVPGTTTVSWDRRHDRISQQHFAIPAVFSAADPLLGEAR